VNSSRRTPEVTELMKFNAMSPSRARAVGRTRSKPAAPSFVVVSSLGKVPTGPVVALTGGHPFAPLPAEMVRQDGTGSAAINASAKNS